MRARRARLASRLRDPDVTWSDARLIHACLTGDEQAWSALIDKYKKLVYSIPLKYGASPDDAADIFQAVGLELFTALPRLRKTAALRNWLITVTAHQSFHWKRRHRRRIEHELTNLDEERFGMDRRLRADMVEELEREQIVREAVASLPARCREIIRLLFYEQPPLPYRDLARRLGLATGSIGFIRGRCLTRLQRALEKAGFSWPG